MGTLSRSAAAAAFTPAPAVEAAMARTLSNLAVLFMVLSSSETPTHRKKMHDSGLVRLDVRRVDLDADALANQLDREDEPRVGALAQETADDAFERAVGHFDHHAFADERAR